MPAHAGWQQTKCAASSPRHRLQPLQLWAEAEAVRTHTNSPSPSPQPTHCLSALPGISLPPAEGQPPAMGGV